MQINANGDITLTARWFGIFKKVVVTITAAQATYLDEHHTRMLHEGRRSTLHYAGLNVYKPRHCRGPWVEVVEILPALPGFAPRACMQLSVCSDCGAPYEH